MIITMFQIFVIAAVAIALLAVIFALQNAVNITIFFFAFEFTSSLALILLITLTIGALISLLISFPANLKKTRQITQQRKQIRQLEETLRDKSTSISEQNQVLATLNLAQTTLLEGLNAIEPNTGLLNRQSLNQVLSYLLQVSKSKSTNKYYCSLCVCLISITSSSSEATFNNHIVKQLQNMTPPHCGFYEYSNSEIVALVPGLSLDEAHSLMNSWHSEIPKVNVGIAYATETDFTNTTQILQIAEQTLNKALRRRDRTYLVRVAEN